MFIAMRDLNDVNGEHVTAARKFIEELDKVLNIYVNVFDDIFISGVKENRILYREFKPWS